MKALLYSQVSASGKVNDNPVSVVKARGKQWDFKGAKCYIDNESSNLREV